MAPIVRCAPIGKSAGIRPTASCGTGAALPARL